MRVCQFRHDGKWTIITGPESHRIRKTCTHILQACCRVSNCWPQVAEQASCNHQHDRGHERLVSRCHPNFAVIEIFAFRTFETGHPFSAASAYFWKVAASAPGTFPTTSMRLVVIVQPESSFSNDNVTVVEMLSAVRFAPPNCPDNAIEKHPACAAAISSSGLVPGAFSNRVENEYCVLLSTPPGAEIVPLPSFSPPFQTALAFRCIDLLLVMIS